MKDTELHHRYWIEENYPNRLSNSNIVLLSNDIVIFKKGVRYPSLIYKGVYYRYLHAAIIAPQDVSRALFAQEYEPITFPSQP